MAEPRSWIPHVEAFVGSSSSASQQNAHLDAIAALVKEDVLTVEALVRELGLYLTTTDNSIRGRGIALLAEVIARLSSKPLDPATIHSLAVFFSARLADWQVVHGALLGCLALLRRKHNVGMVLGSDARELAQSYLQNLQVQLLALQDRMLCFELLQCLLDAFLEHVAVLGEDLVYGVCAAIDNEKDPRCLMITFHIVEALGRSFPDPSGPVATFAEELFEILGRYFPIYFTHNKNDDFEVKRDDLSIALMHAFSSTSFFEPFSIPLLLEKLSSSLSLAKIDSLKYLSNCILHYEVQKMAKHAKVIWYSLKETILSCLAQESYSIISEPVRDKGSEENQLYEEAIICLHTAMSKLNLSDSSFIGCILDDREFDMSFSSVTGQINHNNLSAENWRKLYAVGSVLSVSAKVSSECCDKIIQRYFPQLMSILGVSCKSASSHNAMENTPYQENTFGALYISVALIASCRDVALGSEEILTQLESMENTWLCLLQNFCTPLAYAFASFVSNFGSCMENRNASIEHVYCAVKGLQMLATFPRKFVEVSKAVYEDILMIFMEIIIRRYEHSVLWKFVLKTLVHLGLSIEELDDSVKARSYKSFVFDKIIALLHLDDFEIPLASKLEAAFAIGTIGPGFMSILIEELEVLIFKKFSETFIERSQKPSAAFVHFLNYYSSQVLSWCKQAGNFEDVAMHFSLKIWNQIEDASVLDIRSFEQEAFDAVIMAMKVAVGNCREENQFRIVHKAYSIVQSSIFASLEEAMPCYPIKLEVTQLHSESCMLSYRQESLMSLFASVLIALNPQTTLPDAKLILRWLTFCFRKGHILASQALGSLVNKWPLQVDTTISGYCTLEEALSIIFMGLPTESDSVLPQQWDNQYGNKQSLNSLSCLGSSATQFDVVAGLAWIGKGLLMRGHEKVKDVTVLLLKCLLSSNYTEAKQSKNNQSIKSNGHSTESLLARSAADAFQVLLSDSDMCLNKTFHAIIRPLYKQKLFSCVTPMLLSLIKESDCINTRITLYRAFGHVIGNTPQSAILTEAKKLILPLVEALSVLSCDVSDKDMLYSLLLVFSGILMDENGKGIVIENVHIIVNSMLRLTSYSHMMLVRETAIQCLVAISDLPYARIYPMRQQVLKAISKALDDSKRPVRAEAVKCLRAWSSIA